ncbi:MAG: hypothetical protein Q8R92_03840, partial [Deltaproteobacteria bacterium]|nr:hypothetical protein [Deltaproteobacteria bacterium]
MADDRVTRAYARLAALKETLANLNSLHGVPEGLVQEYHGALDHLERVGFDTAEFRIPDGELKQQMVGAVIGGAAQYTKESYVDQALFFQRRGSVLKYFQLVTQQQPRPEIGFR